MKEIVIAKPTAKEPPTPAPNIKLNIESGKLKIQHGKFFVELWKDVKDKKDYQDRITIKAFGKQITLYKGHYKESIVISATTPNSYIELTPYTDRVAWITKRE